MMYPNDSDWRRLFAIGIAALLLLVSCVFACGGFLGWLIGRSH